MRQGSRLMLINDFKKEPRPQDSYSCLSPITFPLLGHLIASFVCSFQLAPSFLATHTFAPSDCVSCAMTRCGSSRS